MAKKDSQEKSSKTIYEVGFWSGKKLYLDEAQANILMDAIGTEANYLRIDDGIFTTKIEYCLLVKGMQE